jgi:1-acyl-sn-glycerol-3-phosphate acyltransferase
VSDPDADLDAPGAPPGTAPVLHDALEALRERLVERFVPTDAGGVDWMALYESMRRRLSSVGMRDVSAEVDDFGMDTEAIASARAWLDLLYDRWWRVSVLGSALVPRGRATLFVSNHSGLLPWDGLMIAAALERHQPAAPRVRFLVADWLATLPFAQPWITRLGGVRACRENAERLLRTGRSVVAFPEGARGAAKVFRQRYRVQRFGRGGVVRTALALGAPLVPVAVVGAEEAHPVLFKVETLARAVGLPFIPVTPTFPALGPLGVVPLPSKWSIAFGAPIETAELGPDAASDEILVWRMTEELRAGVQSMLEAGVRERSSVWR